MTIGPNLIVVHVVDDRRDQHDFDARFMQVFDRAQFHIKQVADLAVAVRVVADAVKLQVSVAQTRFEGLLGEILALGELDAVRRSLHAVVSNFACVANRVKEVRRHRRLAAGELHRHLPARLDLRGVVQDFLDFFPAQFVDVADLVRVHEAGIAHHVAAVRQVNGQHRPAPVSHRARTVVVQLFVVVRRNIASREISFDPFEELRVNRHQVFVLAVNGALFDHPYLAVALDNLRLDLADLLVNEVGPVLLAVDDGFARFFHARRGTASPSSAASRAWVSTSPTTSAAVCPTTSA